MGNSQPQNSTGRKATAQKLENAKKLGVLSLSEHDLETIPSQVFSAEMKRLRTLDLSKNKLKSLRSVGQLKELKSLNVDDNELTSTALNEVAGCTKLQSLSADRNSLGRGPATQLPLRLPTSLKSLSLATNSLSAVPSVILAASFSKLERLDLSGNRITSIPAGIALLVNLNEVILDKNQIALIGPEIGTLKKLKTLSLKNNKLAVKSTRFTEINPQPLPEKLFTSTLLIDLNLHGNPMTNTQLNEFEGFQVFLDRRQKVKSKTMMNLSVCGLS